MDLLSLAAAVSEDPGVLEQLPEAAAEPELIPPVPETIEQTGLSAATLEQLLLKMLYFRGEVSGRDLSKAIGLRFSLFESLLDEMKRSQLVQVKRSLGLGSVSAQFSLTESGRTHAREYLESHQYAGPAPVPLYQYAYFVRAQKPRDRWLTREALVWAYRRMVVTEQILAQIGPAVSSGNSFLIYGRPGNGKTFLAEALANLDQSCIYLPYAIDYQGTIVQLYDPTYHQIVQDDVPVSSLAFELPYDGRWFKCRRPFIVTGGELSMDMLDLSFNATSKIYDAPFQLKANNGIYLIDDFGRQKATPAEVLNRWIVPMERRVDYLSLRSGGKMTVPFEAFLIFSTNLRPDQLGDEAFLRRIQYKMLLRNPSEEEFTTIFDSYCQARELPYAPELIPWFVEEFYSRPGKQFRRCHPRDVLSHVLDLINFEQLPYELTYDLLTRAFESCFAQDSED